jgi:tetratricopeptide (TPR) repeat protein
MKNIAVLLVIPVLFGWEGLDISGAKERNLGPAQAKTRIESFQLPERYLMEEEQYGFTFEFKKKRERLPGAKKGKPDSLLDQAVELFAQGDFIKSEDKLREVLRLDQGNVEALNWMARARLVQGYRQEAIDNIQRALSLEPNNVDALNGEAVIYMSQQMFDKALVPLNKALELEPENYRTLDNMGAFYFHIGEINKAIFHFNKAIEIEPENNSAYFNLSTIYWEMGELTEAKRLLEKVLIYDPRNLRAYYLLSGLALQEKRYSDFIVHQEMILKLRSQYADEIFLNIAQAFALSNDYEKAIEYGKKSIKINSQSFDAHFLLGCFYKEKGEMKEAINHWKEALDLEGDDGLKEVIRDYISHYHQPKTTL